MSAADTYAKLGMTPPATMGVPQKQASPYSQDLLKNMYGDYVADPNQYGGLTEQFWQDSLSKRANDLGYAGKPMLADYAGNSYVGDSVAYTGGYDPNINATTTTGSYPYALEGFKRWGEGISEFGANSRPALGAWVYTGEGAPTKSTKSYARGDDQDLAKQGWTWISAFDPKTIKFENVPEQYKVVRQAYEPAFDGGDMSSPEIQKSYFNPLSAGPSIQKDPAGKEWTYLPNAAGYAPNKGNFEYGHSGVQGWIDRNVTPNAALIASSIFAAGGGILGGLAAGAGTAGLAGGVGPSAGLANSAISGLSSQALGAAVGGGLAGGAANAAVTGQKTNDPLRIFAGGGAGAVSGAAGGIAGAGGLGNVGTMGRAAYGAGVGGTTGIGNTYAATGDVNKALRSGAIGAASGGLAGAGAGLTGSLSSGLQSTGMSKAYADTLAKLGISTATGGINTAVRGGDVSTGMAGSALTSAGSQIGNWFGGSAGSEIGKGLAGYANKEMFTPKTTLPTASNSVNYKQQTQQRLGLV